MPDTAKREASIAFDAGDGAALSLHRFDVVERLSEPFVIHVQVGCDEDVDFFPHLGAGMTIKVATSEGAGLRTFNGLLSEADFVAVQNTQRIYQLTLRPWFYFLSRNLDYEVFQDLTVTEILQKRFDSRRCTQVDFTKISEQRKKRTYCVQYRESDFQFLSRLMEDEGIYYFFRHTDNSHVLVLCEGRASHSPGYTSLPYKPHAGGVDGFKDRAISWTERVGSSGEASVVQWNWHFDAPVVHQKNATVTDATQKTPADKAEIFDFPAPGYIDHAGSEGDPDNLALLEAHAKTRLAAARREMRLYVGELDAPKIACGTLITLAGHPLARLNQEYLVIGLRYGLETQNYRSGGGGGEAVMMVECVPASWPWRAPMRTQKPLAHGPETATVVGPSGEAIYTDKFGRVKVQFHWDRKGQNDDKSSCWVRVSNASADGEFGHLVLPRVGQEVIIDYLHGDPDRPIVTGRVYNGNHMQAEVLPDQRTRSTWRSQTVGQYESQYDDAEKANPGAGFNLIGMEDKAGQELLRVWASRDMWKTVWRDDRSLINRDQEVSVRHDRTTNIKRNETKTVEEGDESHTVKTGKRVTSIQQNEELTVVQGAMITKVSTGDQSNEVSTGNQSNKVSTGNKSVDISMGNMNTKLGMGNYSLKCDLGAITMEAMQKIELKVGANSIKIDQTGVTINGILVKIQGQAMLQAKAPMTQINGDALTMVKGGIVMIN